MLRYLIRSCLILVISAVPAFAQTSTMPGIDVEIYNPVGLGNTFCIEFSETFWVNVLVRPGLGTTTCTPSCGVLMPGGSANIASGVIDMSYDPGVLQANLAESNPLTVAIHGLLQSNSSEGRIGWALAGNWSAAGDTNSTLLDPCSMTMLNSPSWVYRVQFTAGTSQATTQLHLRRPSDAVPFDLSFADICGRPAFTILSSDINEVIDATVFVRASCGANVFSDGFESSDSNEWSTTQP